MNLANGISKFALWGGLLLCPYLAQASLVTLNLGQSTQYVTMNGTGPNSSGLGTYVVTMGACVPGATSTTCTISGAFTSSAQGLTSGTYSLVTVYSGTGPSPLLAVQQSVGSNFFSFSFIPFDATMSLTLVTSGGTLVVPVLAQSAFINGASFGLLYAQGAVCGGPPVNPCAVGPVGLTNGSVISGLTTGNAQFNQGNTYYFSHLAYAENWESTLTYNNYSPQTVTCTMNFYGDNGGPLAVPFAQGSVITRTDVLAPGGSIHDQTTAPHTGARANADFREITGFATARRLPAPQQEQERRHRDGRQRFQREIPRNGDSVAGNFAGDMLLDPHGKYIELLVLTDRLENCDDNHRDHRQRGVPFASRELAGLPIAARDSRGQIAIPV